VRFATVESRLSGADYAVKPVPKSYGIYVQVAPDGRQYRVDDVVNVGCPNGTDLNADLFVIGQRDQPTGVSEDERGPQGRARLHRRQG
jgi:hypothetical protein